MSVKTCQKARLPLASSTHRAYTERGGVGTVAAAERAKWLMEEDEPSEPEPQDAAETPPTKDEDERIAA